MFSFSWKIAACFNYIYYGDLIFGNPSLYCKTILNAEKAFCWAAYLEMHAKGALSFYHFADELTLICTLNEE